MKKIYSAEDNQALAEVIKATLSKSYHLTMFDNGLDIYRKIQEDPPDMIMLDIILPKLDGLAVSRLVKFQEKFKHIPLMIVSSVIDPDIEEQVRNVRGDAYLKKPFRLAELREKVQSLIGGGQ